jgi:hypothetical protein
VVEREQRGEVAGEVSSGDVSPKGDVTLLVLLVTSKQRV